MGMAASLQDHLLLCSRLEPAALGFWGFTTVCCSWGQCNLTFSANAPWARTLTASGRIQRKSGSLRCLNLELSWSPRKH